METAKHESIGMVSSKDFIFANEREPFLLENGAKLGPVTVRYETYGTLNKEKTNAVLLLHAFSGDAHAAGFHAHNDKAPGWWDSMVGPGKAFDTDKYFVICSNVIGGCMGSTGPGSPDPQTGQRYGLSFPFITIRDMVNAQRRLVEHLGIDRLLAVAGGSMGGMQALDWAVANPDMVESAIVMAATARLSAQAIAFNAVGRNAIMSDARFLRGEYYGIDVPHGGLSIARMIGHITYLSEEGMHQKFGRRMQEQENQRNLADQFQVESYLEHQGNKFVDRFDANSYIYLTKAMDYFDLGQTYGSLEQAFARSSARFLVLSFSSDWLFPPHQSRELVQAMVKSGRETSYMEIDSPYGHDSFLLETTRLEKAVGSFLSSALSRFGRKGTAQ